MTTNNRYTLITRMFLLERETHVRDGFNACPNVPNVCKCNAVGGAWLYPEVPHGTSISARTHRRRRASHEVHNGTPLGNIRGIHSSSLFIVYSDYDS